MHSRIDEFEEFIILLSKDLEIAQRARAGEACWGEFSYWAEDVLEDSLARIVGETRVWDVWRCGDFSGLCNFAKRELNWTDQTILEVLSLALSFWRDHFQLEINLENLYNPPPFTH